MDSQKGESDQKGWCKRDDNDELIVLLANFRREDQVVPKAENIGRSPRRQLN
jgi:hypothetical protein